MTRTKSRPAAPGDEAHDELAALRAALAPFAAMGDHLRQYIVPAAGGHLEVYEQGLLCLRLSDFDRASAALRGKR